MCACAKPALLIEKFSKRIRTQARRPRADPYPLTALRSKCQRMILEVMIPCRIRRRQTLRRRSPQMAKGDPLIGKPVGLGGIAKRIGEEAGPRTQHNNRPKRCASGFDGYTRGEGLRRAGRRPWRGVGEGPADLAGHRDAVHRNDRHGRKRQRIPS